MAQELLGGVIGKIVPRAVIKPTSTTTEQEREGEQQKRRTPRYTGVPSHRRCTKPGDAARQDAQWAALPVAGGLSLRAHYTSHS